VLAGSVVERSLSRTAFGRASMRWARKPALDAPTMPVFVTGACEIL